MIIYNHENKCIYCLLDEIQKEINKITIGRDDYFFSLQTLEQRYSEVNTAYEAAIKDNQDKYMELLELKNKFLAYEKEIMKVNPNTLIG